MADQPKILVRCPNCTAILRLPMKPAPTQMLTCPKCATTNRFDAFRPYVPKPKASQADPPTQLNNNIVGGTHTPGLIMFRGQAYSLRPGHNVIGRQAMSSGAAIQLPDDSRYMSREHFAIDVEALPGGALSHRISLVKDRCQPTLVNGNLLQPGDSVYLKHSDKITITPAGGAPVEIIFLAPDTEHTRI